MKHKTLDAVITALLPRPIPFHEHQRSLSSPHGLTLHLSNISQKSAHTSLGALFFLEVLLLCKYRISWNYYFSCLSPHYPICGLKRRASYLPSSSTTQMFKKMLVKLICWMTDQISENTEKRMSTYKRKCRKTPKKSPHAFWEHMIMDVLTWHSRE